MKFQAWVTTDRGLRRETNQDAYLLDAASGIFAVADGMGGHSGGEIASSLAVETLQDCFRQKSLNDPEEENLKTAFVKASRRIFDRASEDSSELVGMGTTLVSIFYSKGRIFLGNVGDSRCYLFRDHKLWQITEDHSLLNDQVRSGNMSEEQAKQIIARNVITRSVGYERDVYPDIWERTVDSGDIYLLCSDGLTSMVPDYKISEILSKSSSEERAAKCVQEALKSGGDDNVTVLIIEFQA